MAITLPNIFKDGTSQAASGAQLMENLNVLKAAVDPLFGGATGAATWTALSGASEAAHEYEPSATRPTFVMLQWEGTVLNLVTLKVTAGGRLLPEQVKPIATISLKGYYGAFLVLPGTKWKWEGTNLKEVKYQYLTI